MKTKAEDKVKFKIHLSEDAQRKHGVSRSEITAKEYEVIKEWGLQDELTLKGDEGQIAYVRHDLDYQIDKWNLIVEFPLDLTVEKQRGWVACASKFFKPSIIEKSESVPLGEKFSKVIERPYKECEFVEFDPAKPETGTRLTMRWRSYVDNKLWGSISGRRDIIKNRNKEMRAEFWFYRNGPLTESEFSNVASNGNDILNQLLEREILDKDSTGGIFNSQN